MEVGMDGGEGEREEGSDKGKNDGLTIFNRGGGYFLAHYTYLCVAFGMDMVVPGLMKETH